MANDASKATEVPFNRRMTLHDRETNRRAPYGNLDAALREARELQGSEFDSVRVLGYVTAGQIRAEMRRRQREEGSGDV